MEELKNTITLTSNNDKYINKSDEVIDKPGIIFQSMSKSSIATPTLDKLLNDFDEKEEELSVIDDDGYIQWLVKGKGIYVPSTKIKLTKKIPSGYYKINYSNEMGYYLSNRSITSDGLFNLPFDESELIMNDIKKFWDSKEKYNKYNLLHKRGIMLYGPPGSGKTCITNLLIQDLINNKNGLVFSIEDASDLEMYSYFMGSIFRKVEKDRPIITIIEDIDGLVEHSKYEKVLLNVLDGINQIENIVYVATTNYPEKMEERLLNRPSRFDRKYKIGYPNAKVRKAYFEQKFLEDDLNITLLQEMTKITQGLTISHLKEIFASVIIMGNDLHEVVNEMKEMSKLPTSRNNKANGGVGFRKDQEAEDDKFGEIDWDNMKQFTPIIRKAIDSDRKKK